MAGQTVLPGFEPQAGQYQPEAVDSPRGRAQGYLLFFAILPPDRVARDIAASTAHLPAARGLHGNLLPLGRLHSTLCAIDGYVRTVPQAVLDAAKAAAASVDCPEFELIFDRALSFPKGAFVLRCTPESDAAIARLRKRLVAELRRRGVPPFEVTETPHMTLLYDRTHIADEAPIELIRWTATEFALILSHQGIGHYEFIGRWPLRARP